MEAEGRIADSQDVQFSPWRPEDQLRVLSQEEARYSRGFLCANPLAWFPSIGEHWKPLFHTLALDVVVQKVERGFNMPPEIEHCSLIEIDGEQAILGVSRETEEAIVQAVVPECSGEAAHVVLEYIERRLLSTLSKSWAGEQALSCYYLSSICSDIQSSMGVVTVYFQLAEQPCVLSFGVGLQFVEKLDTLWRSRLLQSARESGNSVFSDHIHRLSIELTELAVPPAMLIDYMRSGTTIDLEVPVSQRAQVKVDGQLWAVGDLCQYKGNLALVITEINPVPRDFAEATTRVRIEMADAELDQEGLLEHHQAGAVLLTSTPIGSNISLVISGENVASAMLGEIDGRFALNILPK